MRLDADDRAAASATALEAAAYTVGSDIVFGARWKKSWLHKWLVANAATDNYEPLSTEAFHWSHKMAEPAPAEPPHK